MDETSCVELAEYLGTLPRPGDGSDRERSWKTAAEILSWWNERGSVVTTTAAELDVQLLEEWEQGGRIAKIGIRPAKYPSLDMLRLWGHTDVVGVRSRAEIWQRRSSPPSCFEARSLSPAAPVVFLSHSMLDLKFALRVRLELATRGVRAWLAEEEIADGQPIFEAVRTAIVQSVAGIVLLGRNALGSAWVHSETVAGAPTTKIIACDGDDGELMALLATWRAPTRFDDVHFDEGLLAPLERAYRDAWNLRGAQASVLDRAAGGTSVRKERPDKFRLGARNLLFGIGAHQPTVFRSRPSRWNGSQVFRDFEEAFDRLLLERRA